MDTNKDRLPNIINLESIAQEEIKRKHGQEIELFTEILNIFISGFNHMGSFKLKDDNEPEYIWLLILTRCFHSIRCATNLMLKGYYSQAMSLLRTGTEDYFICGTCQDNGLLRDYLLRDKGKWPNYHKLAKEMQATSVYKNDYGYQSKFTHSSRLSLRVLYDINTHNLSVVPIYDESLFLLCTESLVRLVVKMTAYMGKLLYYLDANKADSWKKENSQKFNYIEGWYENFISKQGGF